MRVGVRESNFFSPGGLERKNGTFSMISELGVEEGAVRC